MVVCYILVLNWPQSAVSCLRPTSSNIRKCWILCVFSERPDCCVMRTDDNSFSRWVTDHLQRTSGEGALRLALFANAFHPRTFTHAGSFPASDSFSGRVSADQTEETQTCFLLMVRRFQSKKHWFDHKTNVNSEKYWLSAQCCLEATNKNNQFYCINIFWNKKEKLLNILTNVQMYFNYVYININM